MIILMLLLSTSCNRADVKPSEDFVFRPVTVFGVYGESVEGETYTFSNQLVPFMIITTPVGKSMKTRMSMDGYTVYADGSVTHNDGKQFSFRKGKKGPTEVIKLADYLDSAKDDQMLHIKLVVPLSIKVHSRTQQALINHIPQELAEIIMRDIENKRSIHAEEIHEFRNALRSQQ
jgi:hypothetical protein